MLTIALGIILALVLVSGGIFLFGLVVGGIFTILRQLKWGVDVRASQRRAAARRQVVDYRGS